MLDGLRGIFRDRTLRLSAKANEESDARHAKSDAGEER
jgi:hypothetical protein